MKRAIRDLACFPDNRLLKELSEGIPLIIRNARSLEETARSLYQLGDYRASEVMRGFAEEEAAKVLILLDIVRCPVDSGKRAATAQYFYSHVAKRIYAMTCWYPSIASFKELSEFVVSECEPYYLEGPNSVDWIFWNSIAAERQHSLYVDYVQDVTEESGEFSWRAPIASPGSPYLTPECVSLAQALLDVGAVSPDGLAIIADLWRAFTPAPETSRPKLRRLIANTLDNLTKAGLNSAGDHSMNVIVTSWSFPLWPLTIQEPGGKHEALLEELRSRRARTVDWIEETESKRNPPPAISRSKVQELSDAYMAWEREVDERHGIRTTSGGGLRFRTDIEKDFQLPSYKILESKFQTLTQEERAALMALAWFTRGSVANWPGNYERAKKQVAATDIDYQIALGRDWLPGLNRWKQKPQPFKAGQWYRP